MAKLLIRIHNNLVKEVNRSHSTKIAYNMLLEGAAGFPYIHIYADHSGSVGTAVGLLVRSSLLVEPLGCFLEQNTLVPVQPRKTCPNMTEKLLTGT